MAFSHGIGLEVEVVSSCTVEGGPKMTIGVVMKNMHLVLL